MSEYGPKPSGPTGPPPPPNPPPPPRHKAALAELNTLTLHLERGTRRLASKIRAVEDRALNVARRDPARPGLRVGARTTDAGLSLLPADGAGGRA